MSEPQPALGLSARVPGGYHGDAAPVSLPAWEALAATQSRRRARPTLTWPLPEDQKPAFEPVDLRQCPWGLPELAAVAHAVGTADLYAVSVAPGADEQALALEILAGLIAAQKRVLLWLPTTANLPRWQQAIRERLPALQTAVATSTTADAVGTGPDHPRDATSHDERIPTPAAAAQQWQQTLCALQDREARIAERLEQLEQARQAGVAALAAQAQWQAWQEQSPPPLLEDLEADPQTERAARLTHLKACEASVAASQVAAAAAQAAAHPRGWMNRIMNLWLGGVAQKTWILCQANHQAAQDQLELAQREFQAFEQACAAYDTRRHDATARWNQFQQLRSGWAAQAQAQQHRWQQLCDEGGWPAQAQALDRIRESWLAAQHQTQQQRLAWEAQRSEIIAALATADPLVLTQQAPSPAWGHWDALVVLGAEGWAEADLIQSAGLAPQWILRGDAESPATADSWGSRWVRANSEETWNRDERRPSVRCEPDLPRGICQAGFIQPRIEGLHGISRREPLADHPEIDLEFLDLPGTAETGPLRYLTRVHFPIGTTPAQAKQFLAQELGWVRLRTLGPPVLSPTANHWLVRYPQVEPFLIGTELWVPIEPAGVQELVTSGGWTAAIRAPADWSLDELNDWLSSVLTPATRAARLPQPLFLPEPKFVTRDPQIAGPVSS